MALFFNLCRATQKVHPIKKNFLPVGSAENILYQEKRTSQSKFQTEDNEQYCSKHKNVRTKRNLSHSRSYNCKSSNFVNICSHIVNQKRGMNFTRCEEFLNGTDAYMEQRRHQSCATASGGGSTHMTSVVLGLFTKDDDPYGTTRIFTKFTEELDKEIGGKLSEVLRHTGPMPKRWETKLFFRLDPRYTAIAVVGIGDECSSFSNFEEMDEMKENIRGAAAAGVRILQENKMENIYVESMGSAESAAEGAAMGAWTFQELKSPKQQIRIPRVELIGDCDYTGWQIGLQKAAAQNLARQLAETPANLLTPLGLAQAAVEILARAGVNVEVKVREWARIMDMHGFLAAAKGSCEPPIFLEISYYGCDPDVAPAVLIGKGVTFDSGGLCLKRPCSALRYMRGDMAGAAAIIGATRAASALQLPINIRGLMPVYENMPGTCAMKPGDIIKSKSGKSVLIHNTDYDGRLSLADALTYAGSFNPRFILDVGTLSIELEQSLGNAAAAVFSNNHQLYETLKVASFHTGDRVWRLPLWHHYTQKVRINPVADVQDREFEEMGLPCTCAAFLREFLPPVDWLHLDTYAIAVADGSEPYLRPGMSGKPTRTLIEFLGQLSCKIEEKSVTEDIK